MRVYLFFKIALVFLALDSCGGCKPEDLLDIECQNQKAEDIRGIEESAERERQKLIDNENISEEEFEIQMTGINDFEEAQKRAILDRPCN